jgi:hypothetical protein
MVVTLEQRAAVLYAAQNDLNGFRAQFDHSCATSARFFINFCLWINEPRGDSDLREVPYLLRGFQNDYVDELQKSLEGDYSLLTEKTREMGATWAVLAVIGWGWLFQRRFSALLGSITEQKIDSKSDDKSLFAKLDFMIESLKIDTPWLYPRGYKHDQPHRTHMKMVNPVTKGQITGEVMGSNWGRSGRVKVAFPDEFAEAPFPQATWAASSRTTNVRWPVFTPKGMNFAGQLANPRQGSPRTIRKVTLHWLVDETKNYYEIRSNADGRVLFSGNGTPPLEELHHPEALAPLYPWYEDAKAALNHDPVAIAQELDVNYNESLEGQMYPQIGRSVIRKGVSYDPALKLFCAMDYGVDDFCALVWFQFNPYTQRFPFVSSYQNRGKSIKWYIPFITGRDTGLGQGEGGYSPYEMGIIARHSAFWGRYTAFYGDPAGKQRNPVTATSVIDALAEHGIYVITNDKARTFQPRREAVQMALPFCDFDEDNCMDLVQSIRDSRIKPNGKPVHGPESHYRSAIEYGFVNVGTDVHAPKRATGGSPYEELQLQRLALAIAEQELEREQVYNSGGGSSSLRRTGY